MQFKYDEEGEQPVSPTGQYFNSTALSVCVLVVLETQIPIDDSMAFSLLQDVFLPISPRFSSVMVKDDLGAKRWKQVEVNLKDHINTPIFPPNLPLKSYEKYFDDYMSKIAMEKLPPNRPLWEIHILKYPTTKSAGNIVFKLHHALGDGYSLMGALLSCLQRADDPILPLTFPAFKTSPNRCGDGREDDGFVWKVNKMLNSAFNTVLDFGWSLLKSTFVKDHRSLIRSGGDGVEFKPIIISTMNFRLERIKEIKMNLGVTINDVMTGIIFLGTRLYMQTAGSCGLKGANATALVLLNTRNVGGYKSVEEMVNPYAESPWGNQFGFVHVSVPEFTNLHVSNPLEFVWEAQRLIKRKRNSLAVNLTGQLLEFSRNLRGPEATARYIHSTLKNSSMTISNLIGPIEPMAVANHPVKGLYFMVVGVPQSLTITIMSYMGNLRIAVGTEKGFIDPQLFSSSIENAFDLIFKAAQLMKADPPN